jgi:hypothetical protein
VGNFGSAGLRWGAENRTFSGVDRQVLAPMGVACESVFPKRTLCYIKRPSLIVVVRFPLEKRLKQFVGNLKTGFRACQKATGETDKREVEHRDKTGSPDRH